MVLPKASRLLLMLMLLSSSSMVHASEEVATHVTEIDIELLEFLGEIAGLESLGLDLDRLLGLDDIEDSESADGGVDYEN